MWPIFSILGVTWPFLVLVLILANLGNRFWTVKNFTPDRLPDGVVDNYLEKKFPGYTTNGKYL